MDDRPVGIFDSGVGGLTVVEVMQRYMPQESIIYAGDTARVPYGGKDKATLLQYGREIIRFLAEKNRAKAIVFACGTTSSNVYDELQAEFPDTPLVDVIRPGVRAVADINPRRVGFIATEATVRSGMFARLLKDERPGIQVEAQACPLFVPMIEEGWINNAVTQLVAETYLDGLKYAEIDALVLGCTHYPLLLDILRGIMGDIKYINMAEYTVKALQKTLEAKGMLNQGEPFRRFFVSGYADKFDNMVQVILKKDYKAEKTAWA
jgi:glutamate racemase